MRTGSSLCPSVPPSSSACRASKRTRIQSLVLRVMDLSLSSISHYDLSSAFAHATSSSQARATLLWRPRQTVNIGCTGLQMPERPTTLGGPLECHRSTRFPQVQRAISPQPHCRARTSALVRARGEVYGTVGWRGGGYMRGLLTGRPVEWLDGGSWRQRSRWMYARKLSL